jgi:anti-sigma regulatory factor (Ser/Thr protein kinase)
MMAKEAMAAKRTPAARDALAHRALLYQHEAEYVDAIASFLVTGLAEGQPAFVAVPEARAGPLRAGLGADAGRVRFADMADMGRNPAWIIPRILDFADEHRGRCFRYVGEPIWPARSAAQIRESTRHEALINLALARTAAAVLCPYDASRLDPAIIADARITHPLVTEGGSTKPSPAYSPAFRYPLSCDSQLPSPTVPSVMSYTFTTDLSSVRDLVRRYAREAGLSEPRAVDLVLAVSEIAANTVRHAKSPGELEIWHDKDEIVCQIQDKGTIADPLAGRRRPSADAMGGHGLWLVNQVCDLVEIRSDDSGTTVRLHMSLRGR